MKKLLLFLGALAAYGQTVSLSDTLTNAVGGGSFTGRITVTLSAPASAQPLYYSTTSLTGWQAVYCLGVTGSDCTTTAAAGTLTATLYANSTITPAGTSYAARFQPAKGSPWSETWVVTPSTTTLRQVRATTTPSPTVTFQPSQIAPGSSGQVLTTSGGVATWAASSGGVTSLTGTANQIAVSASTGAVTLSLPSTINVNAATATALATPRAINGTNFDGTAAITVSAAAGTLTGTTLASNVITSSLTTVGTIGSGTWQGGVIGAAYGGAGAISGILKANGSGTVSAAAAGTDYVAASALSALTTTGAIPYVTSAGVLGQAPTGLFYDSANVRLGVGTGSPVAPLDVAGNIAMSGTVIIRTLGSGGTQSLFVGNSAGNATASGGPTTGVGASALYALTSGTYNAAFGDHALANLTTGGFNTALGNHALGAMISGSYNTAVGEGAFQYATSGSNNTAVGQYAMVNSATGVNDNTAVGNLALGNAAQSGNENVALGSGSMYIATSGAKNSFGGTNSGQFTTTGSNNTGFGYNAGPASGSGSITNSIALGNAAQNTASNQVVIGNSSITETWLRGNTLVGGTTNGNYKLDVQSSGSTGTFRVFDRTAGTGATRVLFSLGAADSATTVTFTNAGTTKSAGYQSSDGSAGITGATCSSFKNGLCVAP